MNKILIVEPDFVIAEKLGLAVKDNETKAICCSNIESAVAFLKEERYQVVVVDTVLPDGNGYDLIYEIRMGAASSKNASVIAILPNDKKPDTEMLKRLGIMDYVTKPFSTTVLLAKIYTQIDRRKKNDGFKASVRFEATGSATETSIKYEQKINIDDYVFDFENGEYSVGGRQVKLDHIEQRLLRMLVENKGIVLKKNALMNSLKVESRSDISESMLANAVNSLSAKLKAHDYIKTIFGVGYMWEYSEEKHKGAL